MEEPSFPYTNRYSNSRALVIGINRYKYVSPLAFAVNDAKAVAEVLNNKFAIPKENIDLLLDEEATIDRIKQIFFGYSREEKVKANDQLLVFFAGHGTTFPSNRGEVGFLVPVDGESEKIETLIRWDDLTRNADLIPAKHIFFVMDACYGGLALSRSPSFGSMRFVGDMIRRYSRQVLTAGKADEQVSDGNGVRPGHSLFTAHLLNGLEGAAATQQGIITANGIMAYVYEKVGQDQYSHQTPHYGFIDGDGDFVFDTRVLDELNSKESGSAKESQRLDKEGTGDILINTSPQVIEMTEKIINVKEQIKNLLSDPAGKIRLDDFVTLYIRKFLEVSDLRNFPVQGHLITIENFVERLKKYEDITQDLQSIVILLA